MPDDIILHISNRFNFDEESIFGKSTNEDDYRILYNFRCCVQVGESTHHTNEILAELLNILVFFIVQRKVVHHPAWKNIGYILI